MGKGLFISISNARPYPVTISYSSIHCVHQNGDEGSGFGPITGVLKSGESFRAQYIEAKASGSCAFSISAFTMNLSGEFGSMSIDFKEGQSVWVASSLTTAGDAQAVAIAIPGQQYSINVRIASKLDWSPQSWMGDLSAAIGHVPMNNLAIPGTHDAATYDLDAFSPMAPGQAAEGKKWLQYILAIPGTGITTGFVVAGWAKAQHLTIYDQLMAGIRYLDLRVVRDRYRLGHYYTCHGMLGSPLEEILEDLKRFAAASPKEVILLDFNHLYEFHDQAEHQQLISMLVNALGDKMAPNSLNATTQLSTFQGKGYQFIVLYDNRDVVRNPALNPGGRLWSQDQIWSPWPNKQKTEDLLPVLKDKLRELPSDKFFVLQGVLSPLESTIAKGLVPFTSDPGSLRSMADQVTPAVCNFISEHRLRKIVMVDWFDSQGTAFVNTVVNLNL